MSAKSMMAGELKGYAQAFKTLDEDAPSYGVIYPDGGVSYFDDEDTAYWAANDHNSTIVDEEAMSRPT